MQARTRQLLQSNAQRALVELRIWTVHRRQHARRVPVAHTLLSLRRHARAVQRALLIRMLIRPHRARTVVQDNIQHKQRHRALTVPQVRLTWTPTHRHLVTHAMQARTRQLLKSNVHHALLGLRIWTVHRPQHVRHVPVAHTLMSLRHHARAV